MAKRINCIISDYIPNKYVIKSTDDFIDIIKTNKTKGILGSLDVESLFTNVPIDDTIEIICKYCYKNLNIPPPKIPEKILKDILRLCTKEFVFKCPQGNLYQQIDGIAMGSPLGPTFANFYMGNIENMILDELDDKPLIYCRYVDDIFMLSKNISQFDDLRSKFENNSVLKFTTELNINDKLPFLDVLIDNSNIEFKTSVYRKPTNVNTCLNGKSVCIDQYKINVVNSYINRAIKLSTTDEIRKKELDYCKRMLVNNGYNIEMINKQIKKRLEKIEQKEKEKVNNKDIINIFYKNQYHANYKLEEKIIKDLIFNNIKSTDTAKQLKLKIYYKNPKTNELVMKNNLSKKRDVLKSSNVIYKFKCPLPHGQVAAEYIGMTQNCLSRRLSLHIQNGAIKDHFEKEHKCKPKHKLLANNTNIIATEPIRLKLAIKEAIYIKNLNPSINRQFEKFDNTLKLQPFRNEIASKNKAAFVKRISHNISFNEDELVTSTQNSDDTELIDQRIENFLKEACIDV